MRRRPLRMQLSPVRSLLRDLTYSVWSVCGVLLPLTACAQARVQRPAAEAWKVGVGAPVQELGGTFRWSSIASHGTRVAIVGAVIPDGSSEFPSSSAPQLWLSDRGRVELPAHAPGAYYKLAFDLRGQLHLVWGEFGESAGAARTWITPRVALWHASLSGERWSDPEQIVRAPRVLWGSEPGALAFDAGGRLHVLAMIMDSLGAATVDFRRDSSGWSRRSVGPHASYASVVQAHEGPLVVLLVGSEAPGIEPRMLRTLSTDQGETWSELAPLAASAGADLQFAGLVASDTRLHAIWAEVDRATSRQSLVVTQSLNGGRTWTPTRTSPLAGFPRRLSVSGDGCGGAIALLELRGPPATGATIRIHELRWRAPGTLTPLPLFLQYPHAFDSAVTRTARGLFLSFVAVNADDKRAINLVAERAGC